MDVGRERLVDGGARVSQSDVIFQPRGVPTPVHREEHMTSELHSQDPKHLSKSYELLDPLLIGPSAWTVSEAPNTRPMRLTRHNFLDARRRLA